MHLFEVFLTPGSSGENLLTPNVHEETGAQVMTVEQAAFVGLEGIPDDPQGRARRLIACQASDQRLIASRLDAHAEVAAYKLHVLGG